MGYWDRTIDIIILTHPHADHVTGLVEVLRNYTVNRVFLTGAVHSTFEHLEFLGLLKLLRSKMIDIVVVESQFDIILSTNEKLAFLYPSSNILGQVRENLNNTSIVVKYITDKKSFLFTGDIEEEVEAELLLPERTLKVDILKVAHQGSQT